MVIKDGEKITRSVAYDFGRYGSAKPSNGLMKMLGIKNSGPGILRKWKNGDAYLKDQSKNRDQTVYTFKTSKAEAYEAYEKYGLNHVRVPMDKLKNRAHVANQDLETLIRATLRGAIWCKLKYSNKFFVHFGHDYYMYIGADKPSSAAVRKVQERGLFVEKFRSPYLD